VAKTSWCPLRRCCSHSCRVTGLSCTVDYLTNRLLHRLHSDCVDSAGTRACPAVPAIPQARFSYKQRGRFWGRAWLIQTSSQALHILATRSSPHTRNTTYLIDTPWYLLGMPTTMCTGPWPVVTPAGVHGVRWKMPRSPSATSAVSTSISHQQRRRVQFS
jgi:hypothetical protein